MFGTFRRHQKWIWILGMIVIIPSFVIFFTPDLERRYGGRGGPSGNDYTIGGKAVTISGRPVSRQEVSDAVKETQLSYFIRSGGQEWPDANDRIRREAIYRVFLVDKLSQLDIAVSDRAVAQMARDRLGSYPYEKFESEVLHPHNLTTADFERFAEHEAAIQQLVSAASLNSLLLTPAEAEFLYKQEKQEMQVEVVPFWTSNFLEQVEAKPEEIRTYYTNSMARYRIPERITVSYVAFEVTNFMAKADEQISTLTNVSERVDEYYYQRGTNSFVDTNGTVLPEAAAKAEIKDLMRHNTALNLAHQAANEFCNELLSQPNPNDAANLDRLAASHQLPVHVSEPFSRMEGFENLGLPEEFRQTALQLSTNQPIAATSPVRGTNAVYVLAYKDKVPAKLQSFEEVENKVVSDFKNAEALKLARSASTNFYHVVTNAISQGKAFAEVATEQKVQLVDLPPFSSSTTTLTNVDERINVRQLLQLTTTLEPGHVSTPIFARGDGSMIVFYKAKLPVDPEKMKKELPDLLSRLRQYRRSEAFNQWFGREAQRSQLIIPEPEAPPPPAGGS